MLLLYFKICVINISKINNKDNLCFDLNLCFDFNFAEIQFGNIKVQWE